MKLPEDIEIVEKSFDELLDISDEQEAKRREYSRNPYEDGVRFKARVLVKDTWYVGEKRLREHGYSVEGSHHLGFQGLLESEIYFDEDCHPYFRGKYTEEIDHRRYNILFLKNTNFASGMGGANQKLLNRVYRELESRKGRQNLIDRFEEQWEERKERHEEEKERHVREKYLDEIGSTAEEPESLPEKEEFFRRWYRSKFLEGEYEEKVDKTGELREEAFERWVRKFREKLERRGFKPVGERNQGVSKFFS